MLDQLLGKIVRCKYVRYRFPQQCDVELLVRSRRSRLRGGESTLDLEGGTMVDGVAAELVEEKKSQRERGERGFERDETTLQDALLQLGAGAKKEFGAIVRHL